MTAHSAFQMPHPGQDLSIFEATASLLSSISMTADQVERGYTAYVGAGFAAHEVRLAALIAFAEREGLLPANVAAEAILVRAYQVTDALTDGIDLKTQVPAMYERIVTGPITPADLGYFVPDDELAVADLFG